MTVHRLFYVSVNSFAFVDFVYAAYTVEELSQCNTICGRFLMSTTALIECIGFFANGIAFSPPGPVAHKA